MDLIFPYEDNLPVWCGCFIFYQLAGGGLVKAAISASTSKVSFWGCLRLGLLLPSPMHLKQKRRQNKPLEGKLAATSRVELT